MSAKCEKLNLASGKSYTPGSPHRGFIGYGSLKTGKLQMTGYNNQEGVIYRFMKGFEGESGRTTAAFDITADIATLNKAGTTQLRIAAKVLRIKYYATLRREELISAIVSKKNELEEQQQMELFK